MDRTNDALFRTILKQSLESIGVSLESIRLELSALSDLQLLHRLETTWPDLTTVKSFANFLKYDLGIGYGRCVVIVVDSSDIVTEILSGQLTRQDYLIAYAHTCHEARPLISYLISQGALCVLIVDALLGQPLDNYDFDLTGLSLLAHARYLASIYSLSILCIAFSPLEDSDLTSLALLHANTFLPLGYLYGSLKSLIEKHLAFLEDERKRAL